MKKIFIDTDIFIISLRYLRDARYQINETFLKKIKKSKIATTSIFNVLETCGILSYNLTQDKLLQVYEEFPQYFHIKILWPATPTGELNYDISKIFTHIKTKQSLGDAQVSYVAELFSHQLKAFVTWNAAHFRDKLPIPVFTPEEYLKNASKI